jgi:glyoxylase-like metal-dependent hydrolase (beta-lactamase superfamily II)
MNAPFALPPLSLTADVTRLPAFTPLPGLGVLPVNSHVITGEEPMLIDTGLRVLADATLASLAQVVDPAELRWIWLTHCDADHLGALPALLELAPRARIVTNYLGMGKLGLVHDISPERFYLVNPGQELDIGDRKLVAFSPPSFDAPETMGLFDPRSRVLFSSDCFGALLQAPMDDVAGVDPRALADGSITWTSIDAPWLGSSSENALAAAIDPLRAFGAEIVASAHLPVARGMFEVLAGHLLAARTASRFVGPDQRVLEAMFAAA